MVQKAIERIIRGFKIKQQLANLTFTEFVACLHWRKSSQPNIDLLFSFKAIWNKTESGHCLSKIPQVRLQLIVSTDVQSKFIHCSNEERYDVCNTARQKSSRKVNWKGYLSLCIAIECIASSYHLLVLPLSSRMVIGRSSLILSIAAGQSNLKCPVNFSMVGYSSPCTCLNAAFTWTSNLYRIRNTILNKSKLNIYSLTNLEQAAVYSFAVTESLMYAFSKHCKVFITA